MRGVQTAILCVVSADKLSPEFLLAAACCRWPPSNSRDAAIRAAAAIVTEWDGFLQILQRQRVIGLADDALAAAQIAVPAPVAEAIASLVEKVGRRNRRLAAEATRLQHAFDAVGIPALTLKGVALAQLAYGSFKKQTRDIDFLVPLDRAEAAMALLEREGYALISPAKQLNAAQRRAVVRYAKDVEFVRRGTNLWLDLQWRAAENPQLLQGIDAHSPTQDVVLSDGSIARTLAPDDLFAYLCLHGATHAWSRLKWLADLNAWLATSNADLTHLYRHAQSRGVALCAAQALLLCQSLLGLELPVALAAEIQRSRRVNKLLAIAMTAMTAPQVKPASDMGMVSGNVRMKFLLGQGWPFFATQCRIALVGVRDAIALPLPPALQFLYPFLRLPLWLWRRMVPPRDP
jgi:hypothetical protein